MTFVGLEGRNHSTYSGLFLLGQIRECIKQQEKKGRLFYEKQHAKKITLLSAITVLLITVFAGLNSTLVKETKVESAQRPILIQGPMPIEAEKFAQKLEKVKVEKSGTFVFYKGKLDNYPVIVAKTGKGMENTAAATAVAIEKYNPIAIINQGTSGGHDPSLHVCDIVLGKRTTNLGALKTTNKDENQ